jgi:hypothetical protein
MRWSTQARILAELAVVRICHLEDLDELAGWIARLQSGQPAAGAVVGPAAAAARLAVAAEKKSADPALAGRPHAAGTQEAGPGGQDSKPAPASPTGGLTAENAAEVWQRALERLSGMIAEHARQCQRVEALAPDRLRVAFLAGAGDLAKAMCQKQEQQARFERALGEVSGRPIRVEFVLVEGEPTAGSPEAAPPPRPTVSPHQRLLEVAKHPLVRRAGELFGATPGHVEEE